MHSWSLIMCVAWMHLWGLVFRHLCSYVWSIVLYFRFGHDIRLFSVGLFILSCSSWIISWSLDFNQAWLGVASTYFCVLTTVMTSCCLCLWYHDHILVIVTLSCHHVPRPHGWHAIHTCRHICLFMSLLCYLPDSPQAFMSIDYVRVAASVRFVWTMRPCCASHDAMVGEAWSNAGWFMATLG